ncbi:PDZ domain-containing protein [Bifidobacterium callitrichos]|uniref:PDZ domain-containing protein n=1 Tax=Bifidobacterium callitrichos TaxID=762209 RepID=A0A5M9ZCW3_9BIFI|nr:trypsin-like peptidase domain-containing protein [Bifidobacterium callitrichos]KAA8816530.1 PDZ domain-containing protein [Bifidobacterium callitrichos]
MADEQNNWAPQGDQNAQPQRDTQETQHIPTPAGADSVKAAGEQPTETISPVAREQGAADSAFGTTGAAAGNGAAVSGANAAGASNGELKPDYASAAGEQTVVSSRPVSAASAASSASASRQTPTAQPTPTSTSSAEQPAYGQYRPAPEYGAYGPVPTAAQQQGGQAQAGQANGQPGPFGAAAGQNGQNGQNPQGQPQYGQRSGSIFGNSNPFASNNPFASPNQGAGNGANGNGGNGSGNPFGGFPPFGGNGNNNGNGGQPGDPNQPIDPNQFNQPGAKSSNGVGRLVVTGVVAALVSAALCLGVGYAAITSGAVRVATTSSLTNVDSSKSSSGSATAKTGEAPDWQAVAKQVSGSVVAIQTQLSNGTAKGSGAILDKDGHIVTNNHVISGAQKIQVTLSNGQMYSAQIVGTDTTTDLAVIKLDNPPSDLKTVTFADSDELAVGENIMAVGNPLGYDDTATTGIVSALNRPVTVMDDNNNDIVTNAVQIDAAINPGNSGGPTFNAAGQVIGINSSIASTSSSSSSSSAGSIGIGFAIPSNLVKRVADEIIKNGSVKHVALGITITSDTVEADGVTRAGAKITKGATGSAVVSGSPADKAGLKEGDTIVAFNGNAVGSNASLLGFVRAAALGDKATLTIVRGGKTMDVDVTLDQQEQSVNGSNRSESSNGSNGSGNSQNNGGNGYGNGSDGSGNSDGGSDSFGFPFGW